LATLVRHCFPNFWQLLESIEEPRQADRIHYPLVQTLCLAILMFACRIPSRRGLDRVSDDAKFVRNLCRFSGIKTKTAMVSEQMINVLKDLAADEVAVVQPTLIKMLIKDKRLQDAYVLGHLAICSDGTGIFASNERHCDQCLTQEHKDGTITYMHNMLEAKVLCANGMALSLMSEPIINAIGNHYDKQDCESKAFKRLAARIKETFPRQPFVHLLDSLYAQGPVFRQLAKAKQQFICCFKRGSIPTLYDEAFELLEMYPNNSMNIHTKVAEKGNVAQTFRWLDNLEYQGNSLGFVHCEEIDKEGEICTYAWLTSLTVNRENVLEIARGGRMRWKIENEGFNEQKIGYKMEHFCNCNNFNVMHCLYLILQIAHMFMQLLVKSNLFDEPPQARKHLAYLLLESLRNNDMPDDAPYLTLPPMQIRFEKAKT
jgi:hypothetical protein